MTGICLGNLLTSSVLAYGNKSLIANGYIPETGTTARGRTSNSGSGIISTREAVKLLPANRMYAEFWFGVSSRITGTNLGDLGSGAFTALGLLGLGAGSVIGASLACALIGDSERTTSNFVYHICESETRINKEIILTQDQISSQKITLPDYVMGILGITKEPINFVTPVSPLTEKQKEAARSTPSAQVEQILGQRVAPDQLTDSQMRIILGIQEINEIDNIGSSNGRTRGWKVASNGQIKATFRNYNYADASNLFLEVDRDPRKNLYRADNDIDKDNGNCFWNGSTDDLTDKVVKFNSSGLKPDDKIYITYVAVTKNISRHALSSVTNYFLFPDQSSYQLPPLDLVKGWNFRTKKFKVKKDKNSRSTLTDIKNDNAIQEEITKIQSSTTTTVAQKEAAIKKLQSRIVLEEIEGQRLIETKLEKANRIPFIKGCYFADARGIVRYDFADGGVFTVIYPRSSIRDQSWFDSYLQSVKPYLDLNNQIDQSKINNFLEDFLFDISDHVNSVCYDNEKYGYEKRFANAIAKCSVFKEDEAGTGIGVPNLDLVKNSITGRSSYDLTTAKFDYIPMQGVHQLYACNIRFTYDFGFCTKGTIKADMLLRTPYFLQSYGKTTRIYTEQYSPKFPLTPDAAIWVGTSPVAQDSYALTTNQNQYFGFLVYPDNENRSTNFRVFEDGILNRGFDRTVYDLPSEPSSPLPTDSSFDEKPLNIVGYDNILGSQPNYNKGLQITTEKGLIAAGKMSQSDIKTNILTFSKDSATGRVSVVGIPGMWFRTIKIKYKPNSIKFLDDSNRLISCVFSSTKTVVDNIALPYQGKFSTNERDIVVDVRYTPSDSFFIDGEILKFVDIVSIEANSISDENYEKCKFYSSNLSSCFDSAGNWFVFFEDENASSGDTEKGGRLADGSHLVASTGSKPGLSSSVSNEISCVMSPDYGDSWYLFRAIVRTAVGENVSNPYVIPSYTENKIHLFYLINDTLMHKIVDTNLFEMEDAFLGYKRPNAIDQNTAYAYGLYHFSENGIKLRLSKSSVVIGNITGSFLVKQSQISKSLIQNSRDDYRFFFSGDNKDYEKGFPNIDYVGYKDSAGNLRIFFVSEGKIYCRESRNNGDSWFDVIKEGILIHRNNSIQEAKSVSNLGLAYNQQTNYVYLTYQSEDMLFLKTFESGNSSDSSFDIKKLFDSYQGSSKSIFVIGNMTSDLKSSIKGNSSPIKFPYNSSFIDSFNSSYSISQIMSLGYATSSGNIRFFYKDAAGYFRAFTFTELPYLDIGYKSKV